MLMSTKIPGLFEKEKPGKHGIFSLGFSRFSRKLRNRERAKSTWNYSQPAPGSCAQKEKPRKRGTFSLGFSKRFQPFQETPESRKSQGHVDPLSPVNQFTPFLSRPPTPFGPPPPSFAKFYYTCISSLLFWTIKGKYGEAEERITYLPLPNGAQNSR